MQTAALIGISTPLTDRNWFSALLQAVDEDTGELFFNVKRLGLVCKKCAKLPTAEMANCTHMSDEQPPWKDASRTSKFKQLYKYDSQDRNLRENAGVIVGDDNTVFDLQKLRALFGEKTRPLFHASRDYKPKALFVTADPDAGGASELGVVSGFMTRFHQRGQAQPGTVVVRPIFFYLFLLEFPPAAATAAAT